MNNISNYSRLTRKAAFCFCLLLSYLSTYAQLPAGFIDAKSQGGYTSPMGVIFSKNGQKMFVWEKKGTLWVSNWNGSTYVKQGSVVLNISEEVADWRDFGFQSVALDPNFDSNGLIYLYYQVDRHHLINFGTPQYNSATNEYFNASISRLARYKVNNTGGTLTADNASRKVLLGESRSTGVPMTHESHAGGQIIFGADGTLMVTTGDNASYASADFGSASETYFQQALNDGIIRSTENVGSFRSQMVNSFCGKLLRMDPNTGDGIPSNPHYDGANPRSAKSRMWALGFRNPYRCSFKTGTGSTNPGDGNPGTVVVADVQNGGWEDMHIIEKAGVNCGWPLYEGIEQQGGFFNSGVKNLEEAGQPTFQSLCVQPKSAALNADPKQRRFTHLPPAIDWRHGQNIARYPDYRTGSLVPTIIGSAGAHVLGTPFGGNCGTSGTYYTGTAFPANYQNVYFFADYGANWIKAAVLHDNSDHQIHEIRDFAPAGYGKGIVDVEYCPLDGSIFYVNINTGDIQKVSFGGNRPPFAAISANQTTGTSPLAVNFSSSGSNDPDGNPITYDWNFGDGTANSNAANPSHTFSATGTKGFTVTLTVKDDKGLSDSKTIVISVNNSAPSVKIANPVNNAKYTLTGPTQYALKANVTDNDATGMQYAWQVTLRHNTHEHREPVVTQVSPTVQISPVGCDGETYYYLIEVKVTDNGGLTARDSVKVYPDCNSQNLNVTNLSATAQTNAAAVKWTNPSLAFDEVMVVAKEGSGFTSNPSGTSYTANASFTGNGTVFEGGKVVYRGTGTNVTVTSLTASKKYFFRVYARKGTSWTGGIEASATPTGTTTPPPTQQLGCLKGSYFNNVTLTGTPTVVRPESSINYDWGTGAPVAGINPDNFSVRWEGSIIPSVSGTYTFSVTGDDGIRLWVNNQLLVDKWIDQGPTTYSGNINLTLNVTVPVRVEYYEKGGGATAKLFCKVPNQADKVAAFSACPINTAIFDPNKCYRFTARHSGKVMDNFGNTADNGAKIQQFAWDGTKSQVWRIKAVDATYFRLMNGNSGKAMDIPNSSQTDGAVLQQYTYNGTTNQQFKFEASGSYYYISARHSGKYLDVYGDNTADGTAIVQWPKNGGTNQQWTIGEVGCPTGTVQLIAAQIYSADGYREGRKGVVTWVSNASDADYFTVEKLNKDGSFDILDQVNAKPVNELNEKNYYAFSDTQTSDGENTYRITLITDNASPQYSNLVNLNFKAIADFTLYPNPSSDYIDVDLVPYEELPVLMTVIDISGREVRFSSVERAKKTHRVELDGLLNGQYILRIHTVGKRDVTRLFNISK
jgi:glucose/arabinose dehydrogenase